MKPWTRKEVRLLKRLYRTLTAKQLTVYLERSMDAIFAKAKVLGLKPPFRPRWTREELETLCHCADITEAEQMLGRSSHSIFHKCKKLNLAVDLRPYFRARNHLYYSKGAH